MNPRQLQPGNFDAYPPKARKLAGEQIPLLRELPAAFVPFLLKETIDYDWKFPAEQRDIEQQFSYLNQLSAESRREQMQPFARLVLNPRLEHSDWVNQPASFLEQLSAHLWASDQMETFRAASEEYVQRLHAGRKGAPPAVKRVGIVVIGRGVAENRYHLFRKLRRHGMYYSNVTPQNGWAPILEFVRSRAAAYPLPYAHWYIDGGTCAEAPAGLTSISYESLARARAVLAGRMRRAYESPQFGAEALRSELARLRPPDLEMDAAADPVLTRFQVSLLTEGSGTQVYSTTFVQWAAREAYRRAQPLTLLARFQPRVREQPMNELLISGQLSSELDANGSLVDADMGAYYTWLNQRRLEGAEQAAFLVWFEDHTEAVLVGPGVPAGKTDAARTTIDQLLKTV